MIKEIKLPELGENIDSADVVKVLIKPGDEIKVDQVLIEIETDKATVEVPSEVSGIIKEVRVKEGTKAKVGEVLFIIESKENEVEENNKNKLKEDEEVNLGPVKNDEIQTPVQIKKEKTIPAAEQKIDLPDKIAPAAPSVRRFAREIGININLISGSGPGGRISMNDVKMYAKGLNEKLSKGSLQAAAIGINIEAFPDFTKWGDVDRKPMSNIRKKTAQHLSFAWSTIPHVTQFDKADITEIEKSRKKFVYLSDNSGGKLTITAILLKIAASALKIFPQFNSSIDVDKSEIIYKKYYNIGIAVDTDRGLLVPVIRDVDKKNIVELSVELNEISVKARDKKLSLEDMQGGCFTISNLGGIGGTYFTPVINSPEVAILGVSRGSYEQVYINGNFQTRLMLPLSLSYDHRIIDGADAVRFIRWISDALENPFLLSLQG